MNCDTVVCNYILTIIYMFEQKTLGAYFVL